MLVYVCLNDLEDTKLGIILIKHKIYDVKNISNFNIIIDELGRWWDIRNRNFNDNFCTLQEFRENKLKNILKYS